ncbi:MAG: hypothetical protein COA94_08740 [Rickettsiales bacterium]|nr:MAG: hypothetical protein COA94_08740 [Rickettsiales bacterium]
MFESISCNTVGTVDDSSATEKAMLKMLKKFSVNVEDSRATHLGESFVRFPFTSKRKRMSSVASNISEQRYGYDKRLHIKGAAEIILACCSHYIDDNGAEQEMTASIKDGVLGVIEFFGTQALRCICVAYKDI